MLNYSLQYEVETQLNVMGSLWFMCKNLAEAVLKVNDVI